MTDKEKLAELIAEIERLKGIAVFQLDNCKVDRSAWSQQAEVCKKLLSFIGSMPDERPEPISPADVGFEALGRFWDKEARKDSDELTHSVTKTSDQEPEEYKGILGEQLKYIDNEIQRLEKLKEGPVSDDLDEEDSFDELLRKLYIKYNKEVSLEKLLDIASNFVKWQKVQLIKSAKLDGWIARDEDDRIYLRWSQEDLKKSIGGGIETIMLPALTKATSQI